MSIARVAGAQLDVATRGRAILHHIRAPEQLGVEVGRFLDILDREFDVIEAAEFERRLSTGALRGGRREDRQHFSSRHERQVYPKSMNNSNKALWFVAGASIGATLAILFAPQSGEETRRTLGQAGSQGA